MIRKIRWYKQFWWWLSGARPVCQYGTFELFWVGEPPTPNLDFYEGKVPVRLITISAMAAYEEACLAQVASAYRIPEEFLNPKEFSGAVARIGLPDAAKAILFKNNAKIEKGLDDER